MSFISTRRVAVLVALACGFLVRLAPAHAEPLPQVLAKASRPSQAAPFDLTYLAEDCRQGIVAFRPAAIARLLPPVPLDRQARQFLRGYLAFMMDIDLDAAAPPALADLDQCVTNLTLHITFPAAGSKGTFMLGAGSPLCLRTVQPFDWSGRLAKWFPKAKREQHAGKSYLSIPCKLQFGTPEPIRIAFFVADDRTLVCDAEVDIRSLLERLKDGKPGPTPPPGWDEVSRDLIAIALDARKECWFKGTWPADSPEARDAGTLAKNLTVVTLGVSMGEQPALHLVATAKNEAALGEVTAVLEPLATAACKALTLETQDHPPIIRIERISITQEGARLRAQMDLSPNILSLFLNAALKSD